jgi:spermidine/putrescine transport system permease protein
MKKHNGLINGPYLVWTAAFIVIPLLLIFYYGLTDKSGHFTLSNIAEMGTPERMKALWLSLILSLLATFICLLMAYPLAMILAKMKTAMGFIVTIFIIPMWMNSLLRILAWQTLLERNGVINQFLRMVHLPEQHLINTPYAIGLGMIYDFLPFMILPIYTTISRLDGALREAAMDLGANRVQTFLRVTLPLSVPGIISGVSMVFLPAMTNYVVLDMLYNSTYIMGSLIGSYFSAYNWHGGSMISLILLALICIFTLLTGNEEKSVGRGGALL